MLKKTIKIISIVLAIFSALLFIAGIILRRNGYILNYEFWSGIPSYWIEFGVFGLFSFIFLMITYENKSKRVALSVFAVLSCLILGVLGLLESENLTTIENDNYTVNVLSSYYLRGGTDTVYQRQNFLVSKYVDEFTTDESNSVRYVINGDKLVVTTTWSRSENVEVEEFKLD